MALRTLVKASSISNLSDARYFAGMLVDWVGFSLNPSSSEYVSPEKFGEIKGWLSGVKYVGEMGTMSVQDIKAALEAYEVDLIETHTPEALHELSLIGLPVLLKIVVSDIDELKQTLSFSKDLAESFVIELRSEELLSEVLELGKSYPILLENCFDAESIVDILDNHALKGISIKGGEEEEPGLKDFDELADIMEAIEIDDMA